MRRRTLPLLALSLVPGMVSVLTGCGNKRRQPPVASRRSLADSADQVMFGVHFNLTDKGVARAALLADTALFFNDNTRVELERVNSTFFTTTGAKNAVLTARHGTYRTQGGLMVARGDVLIVSEDGRQLRSEEVQYDPSRNLVSTDSPFVLTEPTRRLEGVGFRADPDLRNIQVLKVLSGTSGAVTIPNQ